MDEDLGRPVLDDLVCHSATALTGFLSTDTEGVLQKRTLKGIAVYGTDSVRILK